MKKILIILGGGRKKGNTAQLVDAFMKGAMEAGHATELISLNQLQVNGCIGCNACRYGKPCVQKDDFNSLVPKILEADLLVFASPLYFWTISSKIKAFIERFYCIAQKDDNPPLGRYEKYPVHDCALLTAGGFAFIWDPLFIKKIFGPEKQFCLAGEKDRFPGFKESSHKLSLHKIIHQSTVAILRFHPHNIRPVWLCL